MSGSVGNSSQIGSGNTGVVTYNRVQMSLKCEKHVKEATSSLKKALSTPDLNLKVICDADTSALVLWGELSAFTSFDCSCGEHGT